MALSDKLSFPSLFFFKKKKRKPFFPLESETLEKKITFISSIKRNLCTSSAVPNYNLFDF